MGDHEPTVLTLRRFDGDAFVAREKADDPRPPAVFFNLDDGRRYLHFGVRPPVVHWGQPVRPLILR